jgi:hypothetical protein
MGFFFTWQEVRRAETTESLGHDDILLSVPANLRKNLGRTSELGDADCNQQEDAMKPQTNTAQAALSS